MKKKRGGGGGGGREIRVTGISSLDVNLPFLHANLGKTTFYDVIKNPTFDMIWRLL